jgi:hypothetical protein
MNITYIQKLNEQNRDKKLISTLQNKFPSAGIEYDFINPYEGKLTLAQVVNSKLVMAIFCIRDYECFRTIAPANFIRNTHTIFPTEKVSEIYFSFMNKEFPEYYDNRNHWKTQKEILENEM